MSKAPDMTVPSGDYLILDGLNVWWSADEPERIHLTTNREDITDDNGNKPGLRIVFSSNPASADFNPGNYNRIARWLRADGKSAPDPVQKTSRRLRDR